MATILVIENNADGHSAIREILPASHFEIIKAKNGREALNILYQRPKLNFILLDWRLRWVSGWEVFLYIKSDREFHKIPLVVMSGRKDHVTSQIPEPFDYFEFYHKPYDQKQLIAAMKAAIDKAKLRRSAATLQVTINNNYSLPKEYDLVLGGQDQLPLNAVVLGGLEGVKRRLGSKIVEERAIALKEALNYGEAGLNLLIKALKDAEYLVQQTAYSLLQTSKTETAVKQAIKRYNYRLSDFLDLISAIDGKSEQDCSVLPSLATEAIVSTSNNSTVNHKILSIAYSTMVRTNIKHMLSFAKNLEVLKAENEKQAINLLNRERVDLELILLDLFLPHESALKVFQYIQADAELCKIPLVVISRNKQQVSLKIPEPFDKFEVLAIPWLHYRLTEAVKLAVAKVI